MDAVLFSPTMLELKAIAPVATKAGIQALTCGFGPAETAFSVTRFLENNNVSFIILAGIGGAYSEECLKAQKAFVAISEVFADLGRCGFGSIEPIDLKDEKIQQNFSLLDGQDELLRAFSQSPYLATVPMATVSCVSASIKRAQTIRELFDVTIENMEGAAAALVANAYNVQLIEIRSVSNLAGESDKSKWNVQEALALLCQGLREVISILGL